MNNKNKIAINNYLEILFLFININNVQQYTRTYVAVPSTLKLAYTFKSFLVLFFFRDSNVDLLFFSTNNKKLINMLMLLNVKHRKNY